MSLVSIEKEIKLTPTQQYILNKLQSKGQGYIVGGFVRDSFMPVEFKSKDCDFATNLSLEEMQELFKGIKQKIVGKHFQVLLLEIDGISYEIARFRVDLKCNEKDRKEVEVAFTNDLEEDLKRRDFTMNAMAYDGKKVWYIEELCSTAYASFRILKFVGNAEERIKEDALRILRAIRFLNTRDCKCDYELIETINKNKHLILNLPVERIRDELIKILSRRFEDNFNCKEYLKQTFLFEKVKEEYICPSSDYRLNIAYLFLNYKTPINKAEDTLIKLKFSNKEIKEIMLLYKCLLLDNCYDFQIFRYLTFYKAQYLFDLLPYSKSRIKDLPKNFKDLAITPKQIMELGISQYNISKVQNLLLDEVMSMPKFNNLNTLSTMVQGIDINSFTLTEKINDYLVNMYNNN